MQTYEDLLREIAGIPIPEEMGRDAQESFQEGDVGGGGLFGQYSITDPLEIARVADAARAAQTANYLSQFEGRTPLDIMEIDAPDQTIEPTELGDIESVFEILSQIMSGTQGTIGGISAETVEALRSGIDRSADEEELEAIAQQILDAGGYEEWLEQQDEEGPPEELPTELEEDPFEFPDFELPPIGVDPDMPIDIPFPGLPPREEEEEGEGEGNGGGTGDGRGETRRGPEDTDRDYDYTDYPDQGYEPPLPRGQYGTIEDRRFDQPGFRIFPSFPTSSGGGNGNGDGGGGGGRTVARTAANDFTPFMARLNYQVGDPLAPVLPEQHTIRSLFSEYF